MRLADLDVLIADDHEAMRVMLTRVLVRAGVQRVRTAASGLEAIAKLAEQPASVVLIDQNMPGMDGVSFIRAVRSDEALAATPIIMISGAASQEHADKARAAGANAVMVKPVSPRVLLETIESVLS